MPESFIQPDATPLSDTLIASLTSALAAETGGARPADVVFRGEHSNDVAELRFPDGRTLMVKRGRYAWKAARFEASRRASHLLNGKAGVVAPAPLQFGDELTSEPLEAYWRVELPTLLELWPAIPASEQPRVLRSWGELVRRVHAVRLAGHGPLVDESHGGTSFQTFIGADLQHRLRPAVAGVWGEGLELVDRLLGAVPAAAARLPDDRSTLLHNDLHMGNILCETDGDTVRCVGLLDLEAAFAGPPEADLANMDVMHGPHFAQPLPEGWFAHVHDGYGACLDPLLLGFFRAYHLVNMGFYSALVGHAEHAAVVAEAAREVVCRLDSKVRPHAEPALH